MTELKKEAKRLYDLGFAIHWLHQKSKRPIESGWTTGPRKEWRDLEKGYNEKLNVGVRLGTPSKIANGYLTVIDVDIKSEDKKHLSAAIAALRTLVGQDVLDSCPQVRSGRGNGSRHYYCRTSKPFKTWNPAYSPELVKVEMPSKKPSKAELNALTPSEIKKGIRLSRAWEISLYSDGRQVVLPPSIHPDSGKPYQWVTKLTKPPMVSFPTQQKTDDNPLQGVKREYPTGDVNFDFKPISVDLDMVPITKEMFDAIVLGTGVTDRSGYLLPASAALDAAGLDRMEIISVLTEPGYYLGACAYDHAKTKSRDRAAHWLWKYTVERVLRERSADHVFVEETDVSRKLSAEEIKKQNKEFGEMWDWTQDLVKTQQGAVKSTIGNVVAILKNEVGESFLKRNSFAYRDNYILNTPWGGKANEIVADDDIARIRFWIGQNYKFEPAREYVYDALTEIACANSFDPVRDWLDELPAWDERQRLDTWLSKYFEAEGEPEYLAQVFRKWMCAMVMRVYVPGLKFDWMPIFEGAQGVGKSSFGRILCGDKYFTDWLPNLADKDAALALQGIWVVEMGELSQFRKNEMEVIKGFLTRTTDKVRPPHGRKTIESHRRCVFFGTTNREQYLRDDTGNRRFKPVKVGSLDFEALRIDRLQLFAEAKYLFDSKMETPATLDLDGQARVFELNIQAEKMVEDDAHTMRDQLQNFIKKYAQDPENCMPKNLAKFRMTELFEGIGPLQKWSTNNRNMQFAAKALKMMGAEKWKSHGTVYWKLTNSSQNDKKGRNLSPTKSFEDLDS